MRRISTEKARRAYGPSVEAAWHKALRRLRGHPERVARWLDVMAVVPAARAIVAAKLAQLPLADDPE